ncbi:MAG: tetratricopeptide repeat protein [Acidobacteriota bacterium]
MRAPVGVLLGLTLAISAAARPLEQATPSLVQERAVIEKHLAEREWERALEAATALNRRVPDDLATYGLLADARLALGDCEGAEDAVQWMLDLRPWAVSSLLHGARLRAVFGDLDGALEFLAEADRRCSPHDGAARAPVFTRAGLVHWRRGDLEAAEEALDAALQLRPDDPEATRWKARLKTTPTRPPIERCETDGPQLRGGKLPGRHGAEHGLLEP